MNRPRKRQALGLLIATAILALALLLVSSSHSPWQAPIVNVAFLGFTNAGSATEALFALTNPPPVAVSLDSVRAIPDLPSAATNKERGVFSWGRRESWGLVYAVAVDSTNEPLRVVLKFHQRATGPRRLVEQVREFFGHLTKGDREFFTGHVFFVTNETRTSVSPHSTPATH